VTSYSIFIDDGAGGSFAEVDPSSVNGISTLRSYTLSQFTPSDTSKLFKVYLTATNSIGSTQSPTVTLTLAAVPDKPTGLPTVNIEGTSIDRVRVDYAEMTVALNGGAEIVSYELQIYNFTLAAWVSLVGG
jgi:hypothetical protein